MANACGRLFGTVLSGVLFQQFGLLACIIASLVCVVILADYCTVKAKQLKAKQLKTVQLKRYLRKQKNNNKFGKAD